MVAVAREGQDTCGNVEEEGSDSDCGDLRRPFGRREIKMSISCEIFIRLECEGCQWVQ